MDFNHNQIDATFQQMEVALIVTKTIFIKFLIFWNFNWKSIQMVCNANSIKKIVAYIEQMCYLLIQILFFARYLSHSRTMWQYFFIEWNKPFYRLCLQLTQSKFWNGKNENVNKRWKPLNLFELLVRRVHVGMSTWLICCWKTNKNHQFKITDTAREYRYRKCQKCYMYHHPFARFFSACANKLCVAFGAHMSLRF